MDWRSLVADVLTELRETLAPLLVEDARRRGLRLTLEEARAKLGLRAPGGGAARWRPPGFAALGLDATAGEEEIRRAFKERAMTAHPDQGGSDAEFVALKSAYEEALRHLRSRRGPLR
jgi:hypothetical protein